MSRSNLESFVRNRILEDMVPQFRPRILIFLLPKLILDCFHIPPECSKPVISPELNLWSLATILKYLFAVTTNALVNMGQERKIHEFYSCNEPIILLQIKHSFSILGMIVFVLQILQFLHQSQTDSTLSLTLLWVVTEITYKHHHNFATMENALDKKSRNTMSCGT